MVNRRLTGRKNIYKKITMTAVLIGIMANIIGCNNKSFNKEIKINETQILTDTNKNLDRADTMVAIEAGKSKVYLDEVKYYAFNTQATYEMVYASEGKEIDWKSFIEEGITLEEAAKSTVLDNICKREAIISFADEYDITLTKEDKDHVNEMVSNFFANTNEKLLSKINIAQEQLRKVYEKDELYKKIVDAMDVEKSGKSEDAYKNWKKDNTVKTSTFWKNINYGTPIFTLEDLK